MMDDDPLPRRHQDPSKWVSREDMERAQSDAEPRRPRCGSLRDAAENLLIAIGMGWDIEGCVGNLRAALAQSDAEQHTAPSRPDASAEPMTEELKFGPVPAAYCVALSWSGFNVYGDRKSIDEVRAMMRARDRCEVLERMISEKQLVRLARATDEIEQLVKERDELRERCAGAQRLVASALDRLQRLAAPAAADKCDHRWVDARNEHVLSGEVCLKCGAIRAGNRNGK